MVFWDKVGELYEAWYVRLGSGDRELRLNHRAVTLRWTVTVNGLKEGRRWNSERAVTPEELERCASPGEIGALIAIQMRRSLDDDVADAKRLKELER